MAALRFSCVLAALAAVLITRCASTVVPIYQTLQVNEQSPGPLTLDYGIAESAKAVSFSFKWPMKGWAAVGWGKGKGMTDMNMAFVYLEGENAVCKLAYSATSGVPPKPLDVQDCQVDSKTADSVKVTVPLHENDNDKSLLQGPVDMSWGLGADNDITKKHALKGAFSTDMVVPVNTVTLTKEAPLGPYDLGYGKSADGNSMLFQLTWPGSGWAAVGWGAPSLDKGMQGINMLIVSNNSTTKVGTCVCATAEQTGPPSPDPTQDCDFRISSVNTPDGRRAAVISRPFRSGDARDKQVLDGPFIMSWALSTTPDFTVKHSRVGTLSMNLNGASPDDGGASASSVSFVMIALAASMVVILQQWL